MSEHDDPQRFHAHCCPCSHHEEEAGGGMSRRVFLGGAAVGGAALTGLSWSTLFGAESEILAPSTRRPLVVKPILTYATPAHRPQTSWRSWGGIETEPQATEEVARITGELDKLGKQADFPVKILPVSKIKNEAGLGEISDLESADVVIIYAASGPMGIFSSVAEMGKDVIIFCRHKSGPVSLWYEIISPRFLRQHSDVLAVKGINDQDVVVDSQDEILWRLRSLCGLRNAMGTRILAVGGPSGWATANAPNLAQERFQLDIRTVTYPELGELIKAARADQRAVALAARRAEAYLKVPGTTLETKREFVDNAFLLEGIFRALMREADCRAMTINSCMGTIMPMAETSACLCLSTLNDDGYLAFCESDFVVIPSGILLANISGRPMFLNDPTYPHDGIITLAHCTGPRKMNGKRIEPARIMTHFESDYGAAPKVEMPKGEVVTNIVPDFKAERWVGLVGEIVDAPFLPICRDQIDIRFHCDSLKLAERMPGFHWMTCYGDYSRELGYALRRVPIQWELLS